MSADEKWCKGKVYYHSLTGVGRPWIVQEVLEDGSARLLNLDDEGKIEVAADDLLHPSWMTGEEVDAQR